MGIKVYKENGEVMIKGIPSGYWIFVVFGAIFIFLGLTTTLVSPLVGFIIVTIGVVILLCGKRYGNIKRRNKVNEYYQKENLN